MIAKVKNLFHGHPELILGFNTFLPKVSPRKHGGGAARVGWPAPPPRRRTRL